jgi:complement component 1 Q subcomponent-binding protein
LFPIRTSISITKPNGGSLTVEALAQDGIFSIETVSFYKDAKLASELTAEADYKRRGTYIGPEFEHLDVTVQEGFEAYLAERGIDESLALFIPDYAEWKEQKVYITLIVGRYNTYALFFQDYVSWLNNVKSFVSA